MKTKIFCDIADYETIKFFNNKSIVDGFTTNPSLMRLAGAKNYKDYSLKILKICKKKPISFEVFADNLKDMLKQAYDINSWGSNVYVKIPVVNSKGKFTGSVIEEFKNLKVPVSLIIGTRDRTGPGRNWKKSGVIYHLGRYDLLGKRAKQKNNNIRLIELNGLGHLPQIEDFEKFYSELDKVLLN